MNNSLQMTVVEKTTMKGKAHSFYKLSHETTTNNGDDLGGVVHKQNYYTFSEADLKPDSKINVDLSKWDIELRDFDFINDNGDHVQRKLKYITPKQ